jgi:hypothetical protein
MSLAEPIAINRHSATENIVDFRESKSKNESTENVVIILLPKSQVVEPPASGGDTSRGEDAKIIAV